VEELRDGVAKEIEIELRLSTFVEHDCGEKFMHIEPSLVEPAAGRVLFGGTSAATTGLRRLRSAQKAGTRFMSFFVRDHFAAMRREPGFEGRARPQRSVHRVGRRINHRDLFTTKGPSRTGTSASGRAARATRSSRQRRVTHIHGYGDRFKAWLL